MHLLPPPCKLTHRAPLWVWDRDRAQRRFINPNKLIHVQKSPYCIYRLNGKNFRLLLVENSTGTLHWVAMPSAHIVPSGCTIVHTYQHTRSVVCEWHVASRCVCHLTANGFLRICSVNTSLCTNVLPPTKFTRFEWQATWILNFTLDAWTSRAMGSSLLAAHAFYEELQRLGRTVIDRQPRATCGFWRLEM